jgi:hypothetical protein
MYKHSVAFVVSLVWALASTEHASAEEQMVTIYVSEVSSPGNGLQWDVLGRFQTYQAAAACSLAWSTGHPSSLRMTREREEQVPASKLKQLLDAAKDAKDANDKLHPEERKKGDTLKEYWDQIKQAFDRAMNAKKDLTSMTGQITIKQFNDVNNLIANFNKQYDDASAKGISLAGTGIERLQPINAERSRKYTVLVYQQQGGKWVKDESRSIVSDDLASVQGYVVKVKSVRGWTATTNAPDAKSQPLADTMPHDETTFLSLNGKTGTGKLGKIDGGTKFIVEFQDGGTAVMSTAEEGKPFRGTWKQTGKNVTMKAGASIFSGVIEGNRISGTRSRANAKSYNDTVDTWELSFE